MDYFAAIVLGVLQGIFEWLPVSSEGIVALAGKFFYGMNYQDSLGTAIWLHTGTLVSALIYFRNDIVGIVRSICTKGADKSLAVFLFITTTATAIVALPLMVLAFSKEIAFIPEYLFTIAIGVFLIVMAFVQRSQGQGGDEQKLTPLNALIAGLAQGIAVLPGFSRSGLTVAALLLEKYHIDQALRISFLMAIPVTLCAQIALPLVKGEFAVTAPMLVGALAAAVVGLFTINWLLDFARKTNFYKTTLILGMVIVAFGILFALA